MKVRRRRKRLSFIVASREPVRAIARRYIAGEMPFFFVCKLHLDIYTRGDRYKYVYILSLVCQGQEVLGSRLAARVFVNSLSLSLSITNNAVGSFFFRGKGKSS